MSLSASFIIVGLSLLCLSLVIVLFVLQGKKLIGNIKERLAARRSERELDDDMKYAKKSHFETPDGKAAGYWEDAVIVWVCIKGGEKRDSFAELFRLDKMNNATRNDLLDIERKLENCRNKIIEDMYEPPTHTVYPTKAALGQNLVAYREGDLRITDRMMITISKNKSDKKLDISHVYISEENLQGAVSLQTLLFNEELGATKEEIAQCAQILKQYLLSGSFEEENAALTEIHNHLEFYNDIVVEQNAVYFSNGRAYLKAHNRVYKGYSDITTAAETPKNLHNEVNAAIAKAQRYVPIGTK